VALTLLLAGVCVANGQGPGSTEKKTELITKATQRSKLEEMLAQALQNNPDIRVAKAKQEQAKATLNEADAEVNRAILQVAQKVTTLYRALETQKERITSVEEELNVATRRYESGRLGTDEVAQVKQRVIAAKAKRADLESELSLLLGTTPAGAEGVRVGQADTSCVQCHQNATQETWDEKALVAAHKLIGFKTDWLITKKATTGPMAARIRKALDMPVLLNYKDMKAKDIFKDLLDKFAGIPIVDTSGYERMDKGTDLGKSVTLQFKEPLPLGAALQMLGDQVKDCPYLYVREYGILATYTDKPSPGAVRLLDFWMKTTNTPDSIKR
jgi:hypothetical protein